MDMVIDKLDTFWVGFLKLLPQFGIALAILLVTWMLSVFISKAIGRMFATSLRHSLRDLLDRLITVGLWFAGILIAATVAFPSLSAEELIATIGIGSIAVGFAFQDIFENFFAGILILFREPFRIGDYVECKDINGWVQRITIRDTHLRTVSGERVVMPNAMLFKNPVHVITDQPVRRITVICGVAYGEDVDGSRDVIHQAVKGCETVESEKPIEIFAQAFGSSSIDFEVTWWAGSEPADVRRSRDEVVAAVKRALDEAGIEIPFPYRTLTFKHPLDIRQSMGGDDDTTGDRDDLGDQEGGDQEDREDRGGQTDRDDRDDRSA